MWRFLLILLFSLPALAEPTRTLTGKLVIPPQAGTKESYLTGDFQLYTRSERLILTGSKQVEESRLKSFANRWVTIRCLEKPARAPEDWEQAPMTLGKDGKSVPMDHPAHYEVSEIEPYQGETFPLWQP